MSNEELRVVVNDIHRYLQKNEDKYEINQVAIGMKYLFRDISIKVWIGTNFGIMKYIELNRIINKYCMNFCIPYWIDHNKKLHDKEEQRMRVID